MSKSTSKRSSSRISVLSKSMKYVDEDTRRDFRDRRIQSLEADNFDETAGAQEDDDAYGEEDDDSESEHKKKKKKLNKSKTTVKSKWALRPVKPLHRLLMEAGVSSDRPTTGASTSSSAESQQSCANYFTVAAGKSAYPARNQFCSVCGLLGSYSCTRCGSKFCSIKCNANHKETRCFKFSY